MPTTSQATEYPSSLDVTRLFLTHNYMNGPIQAVSLDRVRGVLAVILRLLQENNRNEVAFGEDEINGLSCIVENGFHAKKFEQYFRARETTDNGAAK
jgi:hypothetical protein